MQKELLLLQKIINIFESIGWAASVIGPVIIFAGGLIAFIFITHQKTNNEQHKELFDRTKDHGERISTIEGAHEK